MNWKWGRDRSSLKVWLWWPYYRRGALFGKDGWSKFACSSLYQFLILFPAIVMQRLEKLKLDCFWKTLRDTWCFTYIGERLALPSYMDCRLGSFFMVEDFNVTSLVICWSRYEGGQWWMDILYNFKIVVWMHLWSSRQFLVCSGWLRSGICWGRGNPVFIISKNA